MYLEIVFGLCLTFASVLTYIPQFYAIVKNKSVSGISELSLILMNIGMFALSTNLIIISWQAFFCSPFTVSCFSNLLPFIHVLTSWLMTLVYYIIFITYKMKNREKRMISGLNYMITYILFVILIVTLSLTEKVAHNEKFFEIYEKVLGILSAVLNGLVYIPQIYSLMKNKTGGNISILMYALQTPGNALIIIFQCVLYNEKITTWLTYVIILCEQSVILMLLIIFYYKKRKEDQVVYSYAGIGEINDVVDF